MHGVLARAGCLQANTATETEAERCTDTDVAQIPMHRGLTVGQERGTQSSQGGPASGGWGVAAQAASAVLKLGLAHGTCSGPVSHVPQL